MSSIVPCRRHFAQVVGSAACAWAALALFSASRTTAAEVSPPKTPKAQIRFQAATVETTKRTADGLSAAATRVTRTGHKHFVIQFDSPVTEETRAKLAAAGVRLGAYLGDNAFFALQARPMDSAALARVPSVRDLFPIQVDWKLHSAFRNGNLPAWAVQQFERPAPARDLDDAEHEAEKLREKPPAVEQPLVETYVAAYVMFHEDVAIDPVGVNLVLRHGGVVTSKVATANALVVEMPLDNVHLLVNEDEVKWIEPPLPRFSEVNDDNRARTGANIVQAAPYSLDGTGVTVLVYDGGFGRTTHVDFHTASAHKVSSFLRLI